MTNLEKAIEFLHTSKQLNMPDNIYCEYDIALKACEIASTPEWKFPEKGEYPKLWQPVTGVHALTNVGVFATFAGDKKAFGKTYSAWCELPTFNNPTAKIKKPERVKNGGGVVDTTHKGTWKRFEETVARLFGTHRIPLSGMSNNLPKGDIISTEFIVECKYRKDIPIWREWVKQGKFRLIYKGLIIFDPLSPEKNIFEAKNAKGVKTLYDSIPADGRVRVAAVKQKGARGFLLICSLNDLEYVEKSIYRNNKKQNNGISNTD